jgi:glycosyltransferase involved in cell wall biosynthesis
LRVLLLNYWYEREFRTPEDMCVSYATLTGWAEALHAGGAAVKVLQRFPCSGTLQRNGVNYQMFCDKSDPHLRKWQIPRALHHAVRKLCSQPAREGEPVVVHFNGLLFPLQLRALRAILPKHVPIVVQHHAEKPWPGLRRFLQRWGLRAADGFFFAASEVATPWLKQRLILCDQPVYPIMEGSTHFTRKDRASARAVTRLTGNPVVLWVGHLNTNKDPVTVLRGFETVLKLIPTAHLHMIFGTDNLLFVVQELIERSNTLAKSVTLWGSVPHTALEAYYNSADYFVLGSHYEGSGYALAEAMACGVVPVVTDIPSFRAMTDGGRIGACWPPGDCKAFAEALVRVMRLPIAVLSEKASRFFEQNLSYSAISHRAIRAYQELATRRTGLKR